MIYVGGFFRTILRMDKVIMIPKIVYKKSPSIERRGQSVKQAMQLAEKFIQMAIQTTYRSNINPNEGLHFEKHLNMLF